MKYLLLTGLFLLIGLVTDLNAQEPTDGEMTFSVRTETANGNFSPKHVLAIWIEDGAGFVKSRKLRGDKRKQYLYTWNSKSGGNVVDATTGATLSSHQSHSVTWDCRDKDGELVPDGTYHVYVEFTDQHAQGPIQMVSFTKGPESVSLTPDDETNFKDMELLFLPAVSSAVASQQNQHDILQIFPNPTNGKLIIQPNNQSRNCTVKIYDLGGTLLYIENFNISGSHIVDISNFSNGLYVLQVESVNYSSQQVIFKE